MIRCKAGQSGGSARSGLAGFIQNGRRDGEASLTPSRCSAARGKTKTYSWLGSSGLARSPNKDAELSGACGVNSKGTGLGCNAEAGMMGWIPRVHTREQLEGRLSLGYFLLSWGTQLPAVGWSGAPPKGAKASASGHSTRPQPSQGTGQASTKSSSKRMATFSCLFLSNCPATRPMTKPIYTTYKHLPAT